MLRELTAEEVKFTTVIDPEDSITPEGNVLDSGNEEADRQATQEVIERLESGDHLAWCMITVVAEWKEFEGFNHLGACSFSPFPEGQEEIDEFTGTMRKDALAHLNEVVQAAYKNLSELKQ